MINDQDQSLYERASQAWRRYAKPRGYLKENEVQGCIYGGEPCPDKSTAASPDITLRNKHGEHLCDYRDKGTHLINRTFGQYAARK